MVRLQRVTDRGREIARSGCPVTGFGFAISGVGLPVQAVEVACGVALRSVVTCRHRQSVTGTSRFTERRTGNINRVRSTTWTVPACERNVAELRHAVVDFARTNGVPEDRLSDIELAVSEAATNAVVHAFRGIGESGTLMVEVALREHEWLDVLVADDGSGMAPRDDSPGLGLGLPLIRHLADQFDHRRPPGGDGTEVWMRFRFA